MARKIVLTFDDGYISHLKIVAPLLRKRNFGATFYMPDCWMGTEKRPSGGMLKLDEFRELYKQGFDLGWHGLIHTDFRDYKEEKIIEEFDRSMEFWGRNKLPKPWSFAPPGFIISHKKIFSERFEIIRCGRKTSSGTTTHRDDAGYGSYVTQNEKFQLCFFVAGRGVDTPSAALDKIEDGQDAIFCFHRIGLKGPRGRHVAISEDDFRLFIDKLYDSDFFVCDIRKIAPSRERPIDKVPWRTPHTVLNSLKDQFKDRVICDLGCSKGDTMLFLEKIARKVVGMELQESKFKKAWGRGLDVIFADYFKTALREADVYFLWADKVPKDLPHMANRIKELKKVFCFTGDGNLPREVKAVLDVVATYGGKTWKVPYNEGNRDRQSGYHQVGVLDFTQGS